MLNFIEWCKTNESELLDWYISVGHSEDWADSKAANQRLNDDRYKVRGVRSKYVANMKSDQEKKNTKKTKKTKKRKSKKYSK